jgi:hypothetical protein
MLARQVSSRKGEIACEAISIRDQHAFDHASSHTFDHAFDRVRLSGRAITVIRGKMAV